MAYDSDLHCTWEGRCFKISQVAETVDFHHITDVHYLPLYHLISLLLADVGLHNYSSHP